MSPQLPQKEIKCQIVSVAAAVAAVVAAAVAARCCSSPRVGPPADAVDGVYTLESPMEGVL